MRTIAYISGAVLVGIFSVTLWYCPGNGLGDADIIMLGGSDRSFLRNGSLAGNTFWVRSPWADLDRVAMKRLKPFVAPPVEARDVNYDAETAAEDHYQNIDPSGSKMFNQFLWFGVIFPVVLVAGAIILSFMEMEKLGDVCMMVASLIFVFQPVIAASFGTAECWLPTGEEGRWWHKALLIFGWVCSDTWSTMIWMQVIRLVIHLGLLAVSTMCFLGVFDAEEDSVPKAEDKPADAKSADKPADNKEDDKDADKDAVADNV